MAAEMIVPFFDELVAVGKGICRIYDADLERFAIVDEKYYADLVTQPTRPPAKKGKSRSKFGRIRQRYWNIKEPHPGRNGKKRYFVSNAGWRNPERSPFLHVEVMRLSGVEPPSERHVIVNHIDGDEWNCRESNLEWATHVKNRRNSKQKYNRPEMP